MQGLRFYLLIEDKENESEVRIDGNLETFRELLHALNIELPDPPKDTQYRAAEPIPPMTEPQP